MAGKGDFDDFCSIRHIKQKAKETNSPARLPIHAHITVIGIDKEMQMRQ